MRLSKKLCFMLAYLLVLLPFIGFYYGNFYTFLPFFALFTLIPLIDFWFVDPSNSSSIEEQKLQQEQYFKLLTWIYVPLQCCFLISQFTLVVHYPLTVTEFIGFSLSIVF